MFIFNKCSYEKLQTIIQKEDLILSGWALLEEEYIDETQIICDDAGVMIAMINFYFTDEKEEEMFIALFEVFSRYRNNGLGEKIILQFLENYKGEVNLLPSDEKSMKFWEKCGFESGCYLDRRCE